MQVNGEVLRTLRYRGGETLTELGRRCNPQIDRTVLGRLESGKRKGTPGQIKALADALGVEIEALTAEEVTV